MLDLDWLLPPGIDRMIVLPHSRIPRGSTLVDAKRIICDNIECVAQAVGHAPASDVVDALREIAKQVRA